MKKLKIKKFQKNAIENKKQLKQTVGGAAKKKDILLDCLDC